MDLPFNIFSLVVQEFLNIESSQTLIVKLIVLLNTLKSRWLSTELKQASINKIYLSN